MTAAGGYAAEMRRIDEDIVKTEDAAGATLSSPERITRHVYRLYQKASIAGDLAGLTAVEHAIDDAIPLLSSPADLYLLKAHAAFKLHKLADVDSALRAVELEAKMHDVQLIRRKAPEELWIHGYKTRLEQVLINLLDNAVKFNRPGGTVRVEATADERGRARIDVIDTGNG